MALFTGLELSKRFSMRLKSDLSARQSLLGAVAAVFTFLLLAQSGSLAAAERYLPPGRPDGIKLLPPPPVPDSDEEAADLASVRAVVHERTKAEEARAFTDSSLAFAIFEPALGPAFSLEKLPRTAALLKQVKQEIGEVIDTSKNYWKRLRPYQLDPELSVGTPEPSFSYPSGHSTRGTVYALVLAELFPDKRDAILQVGRTIGWDRVIIGKHYPTDIYAGRTLGLAIMRELESNPEFVHDLAVAKSEVEAAREISRRPARPSKPASLSATASP